MHLPVKYKKLFNEEITKIEKEENMYHINGLQEESYQRGIEQGIESTLAKIIAKKFNSSENNEMPLLHKLDTNDLLDLAEEIFLLNSIGALHEWIDERAG